MRGKGKPTLFSATREGNVADLEALFTVDPESELPPINPNELDNLGVPFIFLNSINFIFHFNLIY